MNKKLALKALERLKCSEKDLRGPIGDKIRYSDDLDRIKDYIEGET